MVPSSGGSALPRTQFWSLGVLSHQAGHSAGLSSWAFGMSMARQWCKNASSLLWETVGSSGSVLPREDGWLRPLRAGFTPEAKSFLTWVVVKVEWHAWRSSWAWPTCSLQVCAGS